MCLNEKPKKLVATFCLCVSLPSDAIFTMGVEPPKYGRMDAFHLDHLRSICARAKNPTDLVEGKSLDEHAHYTRHCLSQKGKHLWDQIQFLIAMLSLGATFIILLAALEKTVNTFLSNVSLMKM